MQTLSRRLIVVDFRQWRIVMKDWRLVFVLLMLCLLQGRVGDVLAGEPAQFGWQSIDVSVTDRVLMSAVESEPSLSLEQVQRDEGTDVNFPFALGVEADVILASAMGDARDPAVVASSWSADDTSVQYEKSQIRESMNLPGGESRLSVAMGLESESLFAELSRMIPATVLVLIIATGGIVMLKRNRVLIRGRTQRRELQILETLPIGGRGLLQLVTAGTEHYLIATDATGVKSVTLVPNWSFAELANPDEAALDHQNRGA